MQIDRARGDTDADVITIKLSTGSPANLTNCIVRLTVNSLRNPPDNTTQIYQVVGVVLDPTSGVVKFYPTTSDADRVGFFYYDIQLEDAGGNKRTLVKDAYVYYEDITKN